MDRIEEIEGHTEKIKYHTEKIGDHTEKIGDLPLGIKVHTAEENPREK